MSALADKETLDHINLRPKEKNGNFLFSVFFYISRFKFKQD